MLQMNLHQEIAIHGWQEFYRDGHAFLEAARGGHDRRQEVFTPDILYNLVAMAVEKFIMAALMSQGAMPYNHTMADLVHAMDRTFPGKMKNLREGLLSLDQYQQICDLDGYTIQPPEMDEIPRMIDLADEVRKLVRESIQCE